MFGAFKSTQSLLGGLLWKFRPVMSKPQKAKHRARLQLVDKTVKNITMGLHISRCEAKGVAYEEAISMSKLLVPKVESVKKLQSREHYLTEDQMSAKNKYSLYSKYSKGYRKSVHRVPKFTKVTNRIQPRYM
ncbi:hypothetical protein ACO0RG_001814 [Hanseniaspora osmophila]|uniref:54S ribosomal protein L31, mitochondrial n=1 Tax=Hanseniaspora osmophila TaxID=56408 RepID=A0A1E5RHH1_9ASCO|nr:54S ribosomal protein L31, mitochondrial [Hanseniaspora osmophila]